ncbi:Crescent membrane and immature virion formation [NY_014 poxvirus]|uniref:Crescent membrane and immature virion formation n=1 Tax=NY_014 poxvirus TaxID=2025360 RepID=UPI000B9A139C|nr:Crescent membrane and immature virion formation [NY_014 poxvirus]AST09498.1 Crescent membrane and immature virion formation [NY_014 poxvirus]
MDQRMKSIVMTSFFNELNTTDIMALVLYIFKHHHKSTIFSIDKDCNFMIDFVYDSYKASDYLDISLNKLSDDQCKVYASNIAEQLAYIDIIKEDINEYIRSSPKLKRFLKRYRTRSNNRIKEDAKKLKIALANDIDYDYIKDAY